MATVLELTDRPHMFIRICELCRQHLPQLNDATVLSEFSFLSCCVICRYFVSVTSVLLCRLCWPCSSLCPVNLITAAIL